MKTNTTSQKRNRAATYTFVVQFFIVFFLSIAGISDSRADNCNSSCLRPGPNLIANGDFSQGAVGFITNYVNDGNTGPGHFGISTNVGQHVARQFCSINDNTSGTGNYMWVDGSDINSAIWQQTITVQPNTDYIFSFYAANLSYNSAVDVYVNGTIVRKGLSLNKTDCKWVKYCYNFNSGSSSNVTLAVKNSFLKRSGSDMAFDDFSLTTCSNITATEAYGSDTKPVSITYNEQPISITYNEQPVNSDPPPVVTITNPFQNPFTASQPMATVTATIENITSKNQIQLLYNGIVNSNFSFTPGTKTFSIGCNLVTGNNTIEITATNSAGSDSKTQIIAYQRTVFVPKPVVSITTPSANPFTVSTGITPVKATVTNVSSRSDITVTANGTATNAFSFDAATKLVTVVVNLIQGNNTVSIKGTNQSGEDTYTQTIIYNKPAETSRQSAALGGRTARAETAPPKPPVVTFINPTNGNTTFNATSYNVEATVLNVGGASGIIIKLNNTTISNFNYNPVSQKVTFNVNLIRGNNTISITGSNGNGTDSKSVTITRVGS